MARTRINHEFEMRRVKDILVIYIKGKKGDRKGHVNYLPCIATKY